MELDEIPLPMPDFEGIDTGIAIELLKRAAILVETGRQSFLCFALGVASNTQDEYWVAYDMQRAIEKSLYPNCSFGGWIANHMPHDVNYGTTLEAFRQEWISRMILQLEAIHDQA